MVIWIYNILLTLGSLVWVPWMLWRARRRKEGVDWRQRSGEYPFKLEKGRPRVWIHAVSVGEVMAALPVLREVRQVGPDVEIVLSVTTSSGHRTATGFPDAYDRLVYFPIDVYRFVLAALVRVRPTVVAVMETELWMNFLDASQNLGATTILINGRISDRSFPRARTFRFFYRDLLRRVDRCLMQTTVDAERITALGARSVEVFGNCKYDQALEGLDAQPGVWRGELGLDPERPTLVVGSTRSEREEALVVEALGTMKTEGLQVVWAPRHLERTDAIVAALAGLPGGAVRRSQSRSLAGSGSRVMVLDTYGELAQVYCVADAVVIGGGFDDLGGQNILQPLAHGKPVVHGPHMQNFRDVATAATARGCSLTVSDAASLAATLDGLFADPEGRARMGAAARELVAENLGASRRYAEAVVAAAKKTD
ncbi:MAG: 3-deoxy-D-manno-octulosonic acid transferase [Armatimonadetes bacterium]|nr:3-deoxy-D-manno-octulosonic acid transferase [Armatimonadota bacterium]